MLSLHRPGNSLVHRLPAGAKLLLLLVVGTLTFWVDDLRVLAAGVLLVALGHAVARVPVQVAWRLMRGVLGMLALLVALQWLLSDARTAALVGLRVLLVVGLANLVTLTTSSTAIIAGVEFALRPLRPLGVNPERVGLLVSLVLRFIPVLGEQAQRVREAQSVRGARSTVTLLTALVIRTLRMADGLGEALEVRRVDAKSSPASLNAVQTNP